MKFRTLSDDPRPVSILAMGTHMNLGYSLSDSEGQALVAAAIEGGINLFDTADAYADGAAESALGVCLQRYPREGHIILTKVGAQVTGGRGLSPEHIRKQIDQSLARLRTDYVDIYLCHHDDPTASVPAIADTMNALIDGGKIRHWGASNWPAARIREANRYAREAGLRPMSVCQPRYSLLYRHPERDLFPTLLEEGIVATTFSPLAHGVLAGAYPPGQPPPPGTRASMPGENKVTLELYYNPENLDRAQALVELARKLDTTAAALATAWCATHPAVASVILGAWNAHEMRENVKAGDLVPTPETLKQLDTLFSLARE